MSTEIMDPFKIDVNNDKRWLNQKAHIVFDVVEMARKRFEQSEDYEMCVYLRDCAAELSNYILGYSSWNISIRDIMYTVCRMFGDVIGTDSYTENGKQCYDVVFSLEREPFYFSVTEDEIMQLKKEGNV